MSEPKILRATDVSARTGSSYPEPFASRMGNADWRALGDAFGLTQYGVNLETLQPGAQSALRHWHTLADEFVYVLEGELVLRTNEGEITMTSGTCVGFKAGEPNGHHLVNRSGRPARFLVVGSRAPGDVGFYPDDDLLRCRNENGRYPAHKDGRPYWLPGAEPPRGD
ncbi:MAG: cupin domain-containing protein [Betaproteobacteria bacterium]|nr:MAG: cupin domain-containing protein [Betaproteobacteria bacterium]